MERGGTNFLLSLCGGAVTSFVMLPCPQKVQLQIISQLWEIPPDVNNYLRVALHPEKKPWMKRSDGSPRTCAGTCLRAQGFVSFPHRPQPPPWLGSAPGFKDLIPKELWPGFSARLGSNIHGKVSSSERRLQAAFMGWQRAVCSDDDVTLRRTSILKYLISGSGKQHVVATRQGPGWSHAMVKDHDARFGKETLHAEYLHSTPPECPLCPGWVSGTRDTPGQQVLLTLGWILGLWDSACSLPGPRKCLYANMDTTEESLDEL